MRRRDEALPQLPLEYQADLVIEGHSGLPFHVPARVLLNGLPLMLDRESRLVVDAEDSIATRVTFTMYVSSLSFIPGTTEGDEQGATEQASH